jgi:ABC-type uncharacterized transport system substrate-binding protein
MKVVSRQWSVVSLTLCAMLFALCMDAEAQQTNIPRIGYASTNDASSPGPLVEAFRQGLRDLGYVEGKNIVVEFRYASGRDDRFPTIVNELVQLKVDVLVVPSLPAILVAQKATRTIPIVMISNEDPVATGLAASLAHPGGNITGLTRLQRELSGKRLELLAEAISRKPRIGVLHDANSQTAGIGFREYENAAGALKVQLQSLEVREPQPDFERVFRSAVAGRVNALVTITNTLLFGYQREITDRTVKNRLPSMFEGSTWVETGGLMSYSTNDREVFHRAATYVDKILKGAKPADLPIEQPTKFELVINLKAARQIGLTIPPNVLARADKVIK